MGEVLSGYRALDSWVLSENRCISYKYLSRALGISASAARYLMADWRKEHGSVHATWALCGYTSVGTIPESIDPESSEVVIRVASRPQRLVRLVSDETLATAKEQYASITSCQIYSLQPGPVSSLETVLPARADIQNAAVLSAFKFSQTCGSIVHVAAQQLLDTSLHTEQEPKVLRPAQVAEQARAKHELNRSAQANAQAQDTRSAPKAVPAKTTLASAFAKTAKPARKAEPAPSSAPTSTIAKASATVPVVKGTDIEKRETATEIKKRTKEREAVEQMMEEDMEVEHPLPTKVMSLDNAVHEEQKPSMPDFVSEESQVAPKARRGRKKVKKQVHVQDEKGYLVTKDEWEWVSCSEEDEPVARAKPIARTNSLPKSKPAAAKKKTGGSIASFFTKK